MPKTKLPPKEFAWTPELTYVVGLLVTDGNLSGDGRHIIMRSSDYDLLETFRRCLKLSNRITRSYNDGYARKPSYRIQFGNVQFYNWLLSIGLIPAKTYTIGTLKIPNEYFRDFLRGHLDGDGSIFSYQDTYNIYKGKRYLNTRVYTRFISASEKHIRWLHKMISRNSPVRGVLERREPPGDKATMWGIRFSKYESLSLMRWIYYQKSLPALQRKRELAESLLSRVVNNKLVRM